jgi:two-component system response regulator DevR
MKLFAWMCEQPLSWSRISILREVLALVARGYTNKRIAEALSMSEKTARNHVSHILVKLGLERRSEATAYAVEYKLVPPRDFQG